MTYPNSYNPSYVECGTCGGTPVLADVSAGACAFKSVVTVVIGDTDYFARGPLGWPTANTGALVAEGATFTVLAGTSFTFFAGDAAALVNAGFASYAE